MKLEWNVEKKIFCHVKQQFFNIAKAKDCSQLLIDSLKDQINSLQN